MRMKIYQKVETGGVIMSEESSRIQRIEETTLSSTSMYGSFKMLTHSDYLFLLELAKRNASEKENRDF